jgi:hypothetical protein
MNGMVTYRTSGMFPPLDDEGNPRPEMFGQVWTLNPDESVARRQQRGGPRRLNVIKYSFYIYNFIYLIYSLNISKNWMQ